MPGSLPGCDCDVMAGVTNFGYVLLVDVEWKVYSVKSGVRTTSGLPIERSDPRFQSGRVVIYTVYHFTLP